jgi:hypothetical protein
MLTQTLPFKPQARQGLFSFLVTEIYYGIKNGEDLYVSYKTSIPADDVDIEANIKGGYVLKVDPKLFIQDKIPNVLLIHFIKD